MKTILNYPILAAFLATVFTWGVTALGASVVFFFKDMSRKTLNLFLSFGAGVMIAASFWSLLNPAIDLSEELGHIPYLMPSLGFFLGGILIIVSDKILDKKLKNHTFADDKNQSSIKRSILMVSAITLHNFPEGLAVGVAFGVAAISGGGDFTGAILLAIGIGLQNFPEGASVSLPLYREGFSARKSFFYGQCSGMVEPIAGLIGVVAALTIQSILPFLLSFSAGAMIAVVASELIPEAATEHKNTSTLGVILGFMVMMILDIALG